MSFTIEYDLRKDIRYMQGFKKGFSDAIALYVATRLFETAKTLLKEGHSISFAVYVTGIPELTLRRLMKLAKTQCVEESLAQLISEGHRFVPWEKTPI